MTTQTTPPPQNRIALVAVNAQWVHSAAAIRILRNVALDAGFPEPACHEFGTSDPVWKMAAQVAENKPDVVGFSVYIWNRANMVALAKRLRVLLPDALFVAGGPEVSFGVVTDLPFDIIVQGEGEEAWRTILQEESRPASAAAPKRPRRGPTLVEAPLPHEPVAIYRDQDLAGLRGKLVYLETSRGCPFRCAFCLSGRAESRPRPWLAGGRETLLKNIRALGHAGVRTVKFLDRTFNAHPHEALDAFRELAGFEGMEFHFEICAELLDEATMEYLSTVPPHRFRFEIGIQSLDPDTLKRIGRRSDTTLLLQRLQQLSHLENIHLHADLIWGLPGESLDSIRDGFNRLFSLVPHEVQLGFLKLLPGAPLEAIASAHGASFDTEPPYEILAHDALAASEIIALKRLEQVFNHLWNSGRFRSTVRHLVERGGQTPFDVFSSLATSWQERGLLLQALGVERTCEILLDVFKDDEAIADHLRLDYVSSVAGPTLPRCLCAGLEIPKHQRDALLKEHRAHLIVRFEHPLELPSRRFGPSGSRLFAVRHEGHAGATFIPIG